MIIKDVLETFSQEDQIQGESGKFISSCASQAIEYHNNFQLTVLEICHIWFVKYYKYTSGTQFEVN